ncbi:hypothetical protein MP638_004643 [Amoeboaphelidium occidentale]|nr:hypothetical protein MP638_004643 [Amoeboaphelidium occidentale]
MLQGTIRFQQRRFLSIHEYQSMGLLKKYGIPVPAGDAAKTVQEAVNVAKKFEKNGIVVKAQVLAGGRGKGKFDNGFQGGVHLVKTTGEVKTVAEKMLGARLITKQTGAGGKPCDTLYICERKSVGKEFYFAILMDRATAGPMLVGSSEGGMDIEAVAAKNPSAIVKIPLDLNVGLKKDVAVGLAKKLGFSPKAQDGAADIMQKLYKLFVEKDSTMVEINPMAETKEGQAICMDAKINFDDNADFRQVDVHDLRDTSQEDSREVEAAKFKLNYIGLEGSIGCLVNGAGLAMATMDIIKLHGADPANFLDVGGGATEEQVKEAFRIITSDKRVKAILVNIFGGIMKCDTIAAGIVAAAREIKIDLPLVVRLSGTNVEAGKKILRDSKLPILAADDLDQAAKLAVKSIKKK